MPSNYHQQEMTKDLPEEISLSDGESVREIDDSRLIYRHNYGTVEIHTESLECLNPSNYLNDTIVQFYFAYLLKEVCSKQIASKVHIFDSIFYEQLEKVFEDDKIDSEKLQQIRKWYEGVDIFDKQFLIFPVCSDKHWFTIVVCYPYAVRPIVYTSKEEDSPDQSKHSTKDSEIPGIIIMDSLNLKTRKLTAKVRDFLDYEWRDRKTDIRRFSHTDLKDYFAPFPKQKNAYDCGIYMLMYIQCFFDMNPSVAYGLIRKSDSESSSRLKDAINELVEVNSRSKIRKLITRVCNNNS